MDTEKAIINILPNSFNIAKKWNLGDYEKRMKDGSMEKKRVAR